MKTAGLLLLCCFAVHSVSGADSNLTLTVDGITYSNVTFGTATPAYVGIFHSGGIASVPLQKLPPDLQQRFGYDPQEAARWTAAGATRQRQVAQKLREERARQQQMRGEQEQCKGASEILLKIEEVRPDGIVGEVYTQRYKPFSQPSEMERQGASFERGGPKSIVMVPGKKERTRQSVFVARAPAGTAEGNEVRWQAVNAGTIKLGDERVLEHWVYCGQPSGPPGYVIPLK